MNHDKRLVVALSKTVGKLRVIKKGEETLSSLPFSLARFVGGAAAVKWRGKKERGETKLVWTKSELMIGNNKSLSSLPRCMPTTAATEQICLQLTGAAVAALAATLLDLGTFAWKCTAVSICGESRCTILCWGREREKSRERGRLYRSIRNRSQFWWIEKKIGRRENERF